MALSRTNRGTAALSHGFQSTATITSGSFTPAAGSVLVVLFSEVTDDSTPALTLSTSGFTVGSWSYYSATPASDGFGSYAVTRIALAEVTSSAAGTVTCTRDSGSFNMAMFAEFIEVTGASGPTAARNVSNSGSGTSLALNFGSAPAATSYLFSACIDGDGTAGTVPSGHTGLATGNVSFTTKGSEKLGSGAQNNSWTGLGSFLCVGTLVEIGEASGQPAAKRWGGVAHAATGARGRW